MKNMMSDHMYTKRLSAELNKESTLSYEDFPETLKTQIFYAIEDCLGDGLFREHPGAQGVCLYNSVAEHLRREYGMRGLPGRKFIGMDDNNFDELRLFVTVGASSEEVLDVIEVVYQLKLTIEEKFSGNDEFCEQFDEMELLINKRFSESNFGYKMIRGKVVKHSSDYISSHVIEPAFQLLRASGYEGATDEFIKAHKYHLKGDYKASIVSANNCFESTLKTACKNIGTSIEKGDTATKLVSKYLEGSALPPYKQEMLNNLSKLLQSSTNTIRNKNGGHGQGDKIVNVPEEISELCLNMTASIVVFVVNTELSQR
jgi:hypothetical protein